MMFSPRKIVTMMALTLMAVTSRAQVAVELMGGAAIHSQKYSSVYGSGTEVLMGGNLSGRGFYHTKWVEGGLIAETGRLMKQGYVMGGAMANVLLPVGGTQLYIGGMAGLLTHGGNSGMMAGGQIGQRRELSPHLYFVAEAGIRYADITGGKAMVFPVLIGLRVDFAKAKQP